MGGVESKKVSWQKLQLNLDLRICLSFIPRIYALTCMLGIRSLGLWLAVSARDWRLEKILGQLHHTQLPRTTLHHPPKTRGR